MFVFTNMLQRNVNKLLNFQQAYQTKSAHKYVRKES